MALISPTNILTGRNVSHRDSFLQLGDSVLIINGNDANKIMDMRLGTAKDCGIASPGAGAPTGGAAGNVNGTVRYRCRWVDSSTGTMSAPGTESTVTLTNQSVSVAKPASAPTRATHWIVERTTDGGRVFFPCNRNSTTPHGTPVATTSVTDNEADSTIRQRQALSDAQGVLVIEPRFGWTSRGRGFVWGRSTHRSDALLTNGSTAVSGGTGFASRGVTTDLAVLSEGVTYPVDSVGGATSLTLATAYAGTTGTKAVSLSSRGDVLRWSEPIDLDSWGAYDGIGQTENRLQIGDDGEAGRGGCSLGEFGELLAKRTRLFVLRWRYNPDPVLGDGELVTLPVYRGCVGPMALRFVNGYAYGIDFRGIWRMSPGGLPVDISAGIANEWRRTNSINWLNQDNFHIGYDPSSRQIYFFICEGSDTYPKKAWIWDEDTDQWAGACTFNLGVTCTVELPDTRGIPRMVMYFEASGSLPSYARMKGLGTSRGARTTTRNGTVTGGGAAYLDSTGAGWTTNYAAGAPVTLIRAADRSEETQSVISNTSTRLTTTAWVGAVPVNGDTYRIGGIPSRYRTGRLVMGDATRKKQFIELWVWVKYKSAAVPFKVRARFDGQATPSSDFATLSEDGVSATAGISGHTVDPTVFRHRFRIPLHEQWHTDLQLEFLSDQAGDPWEIRGLSVLFKLDGSGKPRDK